MLSLFRRSSIRRPAPRVRPTNRLRLEELESRHCPAPVVTLSALMQGMGHNVIVTGSVQDQYMGGMRVNISGVGYAQGGLNSDGTFSIMVNSTSLGTLTVTATNMMNQTSSPVSASILNNNPSVTLYVQYLQNKQVELFGRVSDEVVTTVRVQFSGMATGTATVGSDGSFALITTPTGLGDVQAVAVDQWGWSSPAATVTLTNAAPTITNFEILYQSGIGWFAEGTVSDEYAQGLTVIIKDPNLNVIGTPVADADGDFSVRVNLAPGMYGSATAQTTDWWGLTSNQAWYLVST